ncbi:hypothetical protein K437DRAFT_41351 [Tilletiaria anomala UBC 951]|uniref:Uncharacterized protein n=1 Tax=Tilletiaria anomala (strain ATCC 24038 / CBS 436.72 / UBC 951) TaxID=1037660 RepID=A0A066VEZ4_TILAU|nr:uncharacterized protein K437DRAFT_41351 [Tilletiaria anomala UBC 951]KDN37324.1 hypothetical protein K437DRAFT_41351 [Tilletiaria anomala UBC 951]
MFAHGLGRLEEQLSLLGHRQGHIPGSAFTLLPDSLAMAPYRVPRSSMKRSGACYAGKPSSSAQASHGSLSHPPSAPADESRAHKLLRRLLQPLRSLHVPEALLVLIISALPYTYYMLTSIIACAFQHKHGFTMLQCGLVFRASGISIFIPTVPSVPLLDANYKAVKRSFERSTNEYVRF